MFGAAALTDLFDGRIARRDGLITDLGKFLDPLADKMLTTAAFFGLSGGGCPGCVGTDGDPVQEFMVTSVRLVAAGGGTVIAASRWGKAKTVAQMTAILICWRRWSFPPGGHRVRLGGCDTAGAGLYPAAAAGTGAGLGVGGDDGDFRIQYLWNYRSCFRQAS